MNEQTITLKDIARRANTSTTTVYRVINNKEGVGDAMRKKMLAISEEMGYSVNFAASALSKKSSPTLVLVFPKEDQYGRYFTTPMFMGYQKCKKECERFNVRFLEYFFDIEEESILAVLNELYNNPELTIDGLIIYPLRSNRVNNMLSKFEGKGIPLIFIEKEFPDINSLSCVTTDEYQAGRIAGELLSNFIHFSGRVLICDADVTSLEEDMVSRANSTGCSDELSQGRPDLQWETIHESYVHNRLQQLLIEKFQRYDDIVGIYCTTARNTVAAMQVLNQVMQEHPIVFIGSEVFDESVALLKQGTITCLINKNPYELGYQALRQLFNHVVLGEPVKKTFIINPRIVLRSNVSSFI